MTDTQAAPRLRVTDLSAAYGRITVLRNLTMAVATGEMVAVIGANGAGKTTLLRVISGLLHPTAGQVELDGNDVTGWPAERLAGAGLCHVPEGRLVFPGLTVEDNLNLGAYARRSRADDLATDRESVYQLFPRLADRTQQAGGTMSGGEQQMLAIGRGLMAHPRMLLLDEPSLGLAPILVREIFTALASLRDRADLGVLLIEQNARAALRVADRAYVLDRGQVVLEGTPQDLLADERVHAAYLGQGYTEVAAASDEGT